MARADRQPWPRGMTVIELLVCLAVAAVLAVVAWPSIGAILAEHHASHAADRLAASLALARTTASARRMEVSLAPIAGANTLDRGWQLAVVGAAGGDEAGPDPPFLVVPLHERCLHIALRAPGGVAARQSLRLTPVGYSRSERGGFLAATFQVRCGNAQRQVRLGAQGRIRICRPGADADCQ
ncbi:prepilin-type N-terminal cleavage/methylation domain-containing protein [Cupriavidus pauculus]|uniref:Type II secretion system protein H n=2 Tax=Cupriavidus pauculus TaxID=82633 RepID=A0A3G8GZN8_9BURK|nr:prepilin-type N-terminal cleavage/methylation domain-containing protein [Cupriavidus pauculus]